MNTREILKKKNYIRLANESRNNPESISSDIVLKLNRIHEMFNDNDSMSYKNNPILILKMNLEDHLTIEQIAERMDISTRHVDRLKKAAIDNISALLDIPPSI